MLELHGWVTIRETYKVSFDEENKVDFIVKELKKEIEKLLWFHPEIKSPNGNWFLEFTLFSNRRNPQVQEVFGLYNKIGELAEGSYGLIYLYDDEDGRKGNEFQVFSLSRGNIKEFDDPFLSPVIPIIEDNQ